MQDKIALGEITTKALVESISLHSSANLKFDFMDSPTITAGFHGCSVMADDKTNAFVISSNSGNFSAPLDSIIEIIPIMTDDNIKANIKPEPNLFSIAFDDGRIHYILTLELLY